MAEFLYCLIDAAGGEIGTSASTGRHRRSTLAVDET